MSNFAPMSTPQSAEASQRHILCMKWGTKYGPEYVNRLYGMVRRHLMGDFNFVCLTDDANGIRPEVQCLPIPPLNLNLKPGQRGTMVWQFTQPGKVDFACTEPGHLEAGMAGQVEVAR